MYWPYLYYGFADPIALLYAMPYLWLQYMGMFYYIEMYRVMLEFWRKALETGFRPPTPQTP